MATKENPTEIIEKRTKYSKTFDIGGNQKRLVVKNRPVHYQDEEGKYQDISTEILNGKVDKCEYNIELLKDKIGYRGIDPNGKKIELELVGVNYKIPKIEGNRATWEEVEPDTDFYIEFTPDVIKAKRVLKKATANKTAIFRSLREKGSLGKLINLGQDATGRNTKIEVTEQPTGVTDEKLITQVFQDKVMKMNPETRKREWSSDVTYPVTIDPTSTFSIATDADDGAAFSYPGIVDYLRNSVNYKQLQYISPPNQTWAAWLRFTGITIDQSETINSATLKTYMVVRGYGVRSYTGYVRARADGGQTPGNPTAASQVINPTSTTGTGVTATINNTGNNTSKGAYGLNEFDVKTMVQNLVNNYAYSNGEMVFYLTHLSGYNVYLYHRDWGTTKAAELVIEYGGAPPVAEKKAFLKTSKYWG